MESLSPGLQNDAGVVTWSGVLTGIQSITGTLAVRVTDPLTTPYFFTIPIEITAPNCRLVNLSATTVDQWLSDLSAADPPLSRR